MHSACKHVINKFGAKINKIQIKTGHHSDNVAQKVSIACILSLLVYCLYIYMFGLSMANEKKTTRNISSRNDLPYLFISIFCFFSLYFCTQVRWSIHTAIFYYVDWIEVEFVQHITKLPNTKDLYISHVSLWPNEWFVQFLLCFCSFFVGRSFLLLLYIQTGENKNALETTWK